MGSRTFDSPTHAKTGWQTLHRQEYLFCRSFAKEFLDPSQERIHKSQKSKAQKVKNSQRFFDGFPNFCIFLSIKFKKKKKAEKHQVVAALFQFEYMHHAPDYTSFPGWTESTQVPHMIICDWVVRTPYTPFRKDLYLIDKVATYRALITPLKTWFGQRVRLHHSDFTYSSGSCNLKNLSSKSTLLGVLEVDKTHLEYSECYKRKQLQLDINKTTDTMVACCILILDTNIQTKVMCWGNDIRTNSANILIKKIGMVIKARLDPWRLLWISTNY